MNSTNNKYKILWFNGDLKVDITNPKYMLLNQVKEKAEQKHSISIQACITGDDFLEFAKSKKWDAFVLDYKGFMSEESDEQIIILKLIKKIQSIGKNRDALRLCATMEPPISDEYDDMIEHSGILKNSNTGKWFFLITKNSIDQSLQVFDTIKTGLDDDWRLFDGYREIKDIYDSTNILSGKNAIKDILLWKQNRDHAALLNTKFESGIRDVLDEIYIKLLRIGFYNNSSKTGNYNNAVQPPLSFARYVNGGVPDKNNPKKFIYYLNSSCRFAWEAAAMSFLDSFQNAAHHKNTYGQPSVNDVSFSYYYDSFIQMVFDSLVIFSKWYVRFMEDYQNSQNITKYFNNIPW